jgi:hypothetical protein
MHISFRAFEAQQPNQSTLSGDENWTERVLIKMQRALAARKMQLDNIKHNNNNNNNRGSLLHLNGIHPAR